MKMPVRIQTAEFHLNEEVAVLRAGRLEIGAVACFMGTVRDLNDGHAIQSMTLEHYPGMTECALQDITAQAQQRFDIIDALVIHRVGTLAVGDPIVLVAVVAEHRGPALTACEFIIDKLKTEAPFWKKESTPQGARWVEARHSDTEALKKWHSSSTQV